MDQGNSDLQQLYENVTNITAALANASATSLNGFADGANDNHHDPSAEMLAQFEKSYKGIHGYLAAITCACGIIFNLCNVYILTRKKMKHSPTNILLTSIAIFDLLMELTYLPFTIHFHILTDTSEVYGHHRAWVYYAITSVDVMVLCHTASMWMTVALATFRYIYVCQHQKAPILCTKEKAYLTIALVTIVSVLICVPTLICYTVVDIPVPGTGNETSNTTNPWIGYTAACTSSNNLLQTLNFLINGGIVKTCGCIVLLIFTILLLISIRKANQRHQMLMNKKSKDKRGDHQRTTIMLIAVVMSFAVAELPQGILVLISSRDDWYLTNVYANLADILDLLVLLNSSVNFVLYATMSHQFRTTFYDKLVSPLVKHFKKKKYEGQGDMLELQKLNDGGKQNGKHGQRKVKLWRKSTSGSSSAKSLLATEVTSVT